jgi:MFS family permease
MLAREIHEDDDKHTSLRLGHFQPERDQPAGGRRDQEHRARGVRCPQGQPPLECCVDRRDLSLVGAVGLVGLLGRPLSGTLSDVLGREVVYTVGSGMQMAGIVALLTLGDGQRLWPFLLFVALNGLSDGIGGLVVGAKAADLFPTSALGTVMGLVQTGRGLGIMVGPLLGGLLFDLQGHYGAAYLLAVALVYVAIGCMWGVRLTGARRTTEAQPRQPLTGHDTDLG